MLNIITELKELSNFIGPKQTNAKDPFVYKQAFDLIENWQPDPQGTTTIEKHAGFEVAHLGLYWPGYSKTKFKSLADSVANPFQETPEEDSIQYDEAWAYINAVGGAIKTISSLAGSFNTVPDWNNLHQRFNQLNRLKPEAGTEAQTLLGILR